MRDCSIDRTVRLTPQAPKATRARIAQPRATVGVYRHLTRLPPRGFEAGRAWGMARRVERGIAAHARTDEARKFRNINADGVFGTHKDEVPTKQRLRSLLGAPRPARYAVWR